MSRKPRQRARQADPPISRRRRQDPPLHLPDAARMPTAEAAAAPKAPPQPTGRNGALIASAEVLTVFWGSAWLSAQARLAADAGQLLDFIRTRPLVDRLAEYRVAGAGSVTDGGWERWRWRQLRWRTRCRTRRSGTGSRMRCRPMPPCLRRHRIRSALSIRRPVPGSSGVAAAPARASAAITTTSRSRFSARSCSTPAAAGARAACPHSTRSPPRRRTRSARRSPTRSRVTPGMTMRTAKSATSARGSQAGLRPHDAVGMAIQARLPRPGGCDGRDAVDASAPLARHRHRRSRRACRRRAARRAVRVAHGRGASVCGP